MPYRLLLPILLFGFFNSHAQKAGSKPHMLYDVYTGSLPHGRRLQYTQLILRHECRSCDEGTYVFKEGKNELKGEWTVLRSSAINPNATVVELIAKDQNVYFLRRKDKQLQRLDTALKEIKPASRYLLKKQ